MIDLRYKGLPNTVEVDGKPFLIKTDFRDWIDFGVRIKNPHTTLGQIHDLFIDTNVPILEENLNSLIKFYSNPNPTPQHIESDNNKDNYLDYVLDGEYIVSSFMQAYGIDLTSIDYMHWHLFKALTIGLPANTKLMEIISIRSYKKIKIDEDKQRQKLKRIWTLPKQQDPQELEILQEINNEFYACT